MNTFKVSQTLQKNIENILRRRAIPFEFLEEEGIIKCAVPSSSDYFHKIVIRAKMEKEQEENNSSIPFIAKCEEDDFQVLGEIGDAYIIR